MLPPAPISPVFQCLCLLCQTVVLQAAFDIINAAPLAGRERGDIRFGFFWRLLAVNIRQPAHGVSVAAVHTQGLLVIAFGGGIIFARHRHIAQPKHCIAVGVIDITCLLEQPFCRVRIIGFQRGIALLDRQPVAVYFQQTVPFVVIAVVRIQREGFFQIRHRISAIAFLRIRPPSAPRASLSFGFARTACCSSGMALPAMPESTAAKPCARARKAGSASCFAVLPVAIVQQLRYRHR